MTTRTFFGVGIILIDRDKAHTSGRLKANTRLSICSTGEYVAIIEVNLPPGVELNAGTEHSVPLRVLAGQEIALGEIYEIRNPIEPIGVVRFTQLSPE